MLPQWRKNGRPNPKHGMKLSHTLHPTWKIDLLIISTILEIKNVLNKETLKLIIISYAVRFTCFFPQTKNIFIYHLFKHALTTLNDLKISLEKSSVFFFTVYKKQRLHYDITLKNSDYHPSKKWNSMKRGSIWVLDLMEQHEWNSIAWNVVLEWVA